MMSFWKQLWHVPRWWQAAPDQLESTDSIDGEEGAFPWEGYCIAPRCFDSPERQAAPQEMEGGQPAHLPIKVYRLPLRHKVPGMDFRWKVGLKTHSIEGCGRRGLQFKAYKALALPHVLGLSDNAHWRWPFIPVSFLVGLKGAAMLPHMGPRHRHHPPQSVPTISCLAPAAKVKILSPLGGSLGLRPTIEILPEPKVTIQRDVRVAAHSYLTLGLTLQRGNTGPCCAPHASIQLGWKHKNLITVQPQQEGKKLRVDYRGAVDLPWDTTAAVRAHGEVPLMKAKGGGMLQQSPRLDSIKLTKFIGKREARTRPAPTWRYLEAQRRIGSRDEIVVVPGHFIDPEGDTGAPGERDFNKTVAEKVAARLGRAGWRVLRPDRDAPHLMWEEYINWVSARTLRGVPVIEIHGQGPEAHTEGAVWGVIGDARTPLNKELAKEFGWYPSDWKELAVPRRGGVIVEGFNSDEVLAMTAERRELAADRLAWRVWQCIEEAGETNRAKRGLKTDRGDSKPAGAEGPGADPANQGPAAPTSANLDESRKTSRHSQGTHAGEAGSNRSSAAASGSIDRVVPQVGLDKGSAQNHAQHEGS